MVAAGQGTGGPTCTQGHSLQLTQPLPALPHPRHSHTTTHHPATPHSCPAPPATLLQSAPPTAPAQQRKSSTFASQLCGSFSSPIMPLGGRDQKQIPSSAGICCSLTLPHPTPTVLPGQGPSHHLSVTPPPGDCQSTGSESHRHRQHTGHEGPERRETPLVLYWPGPAHSHLP